MTAILLVDTDADRRRDIRKDFQSHPDWKLYETTSADIGRTTFQEQAAGCF